MKKFSILLISFLLFITNVGANEKIGVKFSKCVDGDTAKVILNEGKVFDYYPVVIFNRGTAKLIKDGEEIAYDDDSTPGIAVGDYAFKYDSEGKKLDTASTTVASGDLSKYENPVVTDSKVYIQK